MKMEVTTVRITDANPAHVRLSVWVNGGLICTPGGICLRRDDEAAPFITLLNPIRIEYQNAECERFAKEAFPKYTEREEPLWRYRLDLPGLDRGL